MSGRQFADPKFGFSARLKDSQVERVQARWGISPTIVRVENNGAVSKNVLVWNIKQRAGT
jgi:hypothetical protein